MGLASPTQNEGQCNHANSGLLSHIYNKIVCLLLQASASYACTDNSHRYLDVSVWGSSPISDSHCLSNNETKLLFGFPW